MTPDEYVALLAWVDAHGWVPQTPGCPRCGQGPMMLLGGGHQAFCGNDDCDVMTWDPAEDAATFEANARPVRITHHD